MDSKTLIPVVLNWNNYEDTSECLDSLSSIEYPQLHPILVDNGSIDGSGDKLDEEYKDVETIFLEKNRGFAGGMNAGIERALEANADYILLLNNDVLLPEDFGITEMIARLEEDPSIGLLTPKISYYPETNKLWFVQGKIDWRDGTSSHNATLPEDNINGLLDNDTVPFCCSLVRAEVFREVGPLPEDYFVYTEDRHFSTLIKDHDYRIVTTVESTAHHKVSASSGGENSPLSVYYITRNGILFLRAFPEHRQRGFRLFYCWWCILRAGYLSLNGEYECLIPHLLGIIDGILNKTGKTRYL